MCRSIFKLMWVGIFLVVNHEQSVLKQCERAVELAPSGQALRTLLSWPAFQWSVCSFTAETAEMVRTDQNIKISKTFWEEVTYRHIWFISKSRFLITALPIKMQISTENLDCCHNYDKSTRCRARNVTQK